MSKSTLLDHVIFGNLILTRLTELGAPKALQPHVSVFTDVHNTFVVASQGADDARVARDGALADVNSAGEALDGLIDTLADKIVGASLGTRRSPLARFSKHSPSDLQRLPYKEKAEEVRKVAAAAGKAGKTAEVKAAAVACRDGADALAKALGKLAGPQAAYTKALNARNKLVPGWELALKKFKKQAAAAWVEDEATYEAVFAPAEKVQRPVHRRKKSTAPAGASPSGTPAEEPAAESTEGMNDANEQTQPASGAEAGSTQGAGAAKLIAQPGGSAVSAASKAAPAKSAEVAKGGDKKSAVAKANSGEGKVAKKSGTIVHRPRAESQGVQAARRVRRKG